MSKHLFQDIPVAERLRYLQDNAYRVEPKYSYLRELDENEIRERQDQLSQNLIAMDRADQVLKEAKEVFNAETKPLICLLSEVCYFTSYFDLFSNQIH